MTLEQLIAQQNALLQELIQTLQQKHPLGFGQSPRPQYIYCNRSQGGLWYTLSEDASRSPQPIAHTALTGYVERLESRQVERRGKETRKIHLHIRGDRRYILEAGYEANFAKGVMSALAVMTPPQLQQPITLEVQAAESDEVLFCRVYANGDLVFAPWDEETDWRTVARRAIANVEVANGREERVAA